MLRMSVLAILLLASGCAATGSTGGSGNDGRCLYTVNGPRGQHIVWAPCDQPPPMMRQRLTEGRQD
jgi:hypothetical protein